MEYRMRLGNLLHVNLHRLRSAFTIFAAVMKRPFFALPATRMAAIAFTVLMAVSANEPLAAQTNNGIPKLFVLVNTMVETD